MGKTKAKKFKTKPSNPSGVPSLKECEENEALNPIKVDAGVIESITEKLQSRNAEDKECSAVIIANMADNDKFIASLITAGVLRVAAPLLLDKNLAVRHAIAGCLRNVAACGTFLTSEAMVEQDIMTSLVMLLEQYKEPWSSVKTSESSIDSKSAIFIEACNLLWILCEDSDTAVSIFNNRNLIEVLSPCLNVEKYSLHIPIAVAQCLQTCSENNPELSEILRQSSIEEQLNTLMSLPPIDTEHILLKVLTAGIKLNIFSGKLKNCMSDVTTSIVEVIFSTLNEPILSTLEKLNKQITSLKAEKADRYHEEKDLEEKAAAVKKTKNDTVNLLSAKQIALEILGNIFDDDDDDSDDWDDISSSDSSEIIGDSSMEVDEVNVHPDEIGLGITADLYKIIVNGNVLEKVTKQIINPSNETLQILQDNPKAKECLKRINTLRSTALLCLNNIIQKGEVKDLGGPSKFLELWLYLANLLFKETDLNNVEQVESITRSMSGVARKLVEAKSASQFSNMTELDLELLINVCQQSEDSRVKVHIIQILGTIGCFLSVNFPNSTNLIKLIGSVLLDICSKNIDLWVIAEALDAIFDVFAEDQVDIIAKDIDLVDKLTLMFPAYNAKIKQKKSSGDHVAVIMTAKNNLLRFIKYKNNLNT